MSTTEVILEHLISGIQAAIWLLLFTLLILGHDWLQWDTVKELPGELILAFLAIIYPIGMFIDEVADKIFYLWGENIRNRIKIDANLSENDQKKARVGFLLQHTDDDFLKAHFSYIRTRIRIARATALNFSLITIFLTTLLAFRFTTNAETLAIVIGFGGFLVSLAVFAWYRFTCTFTHRVIEVLRDKQEISS